MSELSELAQERLRILRAADDMRLHVNKAGRYVIDGEQKRPERKVRERLMSTGFLSYPALFGHSGVVRLTADGRSELRELKALAGGSE